MNAPKVKKAWPRDLRELPDWPDEFGLEIPDQAMEPVLRRGVVAHYSKTLGPVDGRPVLVRTQDGSAYTRTYKDLGEGHFEVHADAPGHPVWDSKRHSLVILAACTGWRVPDRWSESDTPLEERPIHYVARASKGGRIIPNSRLSDFFDGRDANDKAYDLRDSLRATIPDASVFTAATIEAAKEVIARPTDADD